MKLRFFLLCFLGLSISSIWAQNIPLKASLGVYLDKAPANTQAIYQVKDITPNSTAESIGLMAGDILLAINQKEISHPSILQGVLQTFYAGDPIQLTILRNEKKMKLEGIGSGKTLCRASRKTLRFF